MNNCAKKTAIGHRMTYVGCEMLSKNLTPLPPPTSPIKMFPIMSKGKNVTNPYVFAGCWVAGGVYKAMNIVTNQLANPM